MKLVQRIRSRWMKWQRRKWYGARIVVQTSECDMVFDVDKFQIDIHKEPISVHNDFCSNRRVTIVGTRESLFARAHREALEKSVMKNV